jgi:hypothetical protein
MILNELSHLSQSRFSCGTPSNPAIKYVSDQVNAEDNDSVKGVIQRECNRVTGPRVKECYPNRRAHSAAGRKRGDRPARYSISSPVGCCQGYAGS